MRGFNLKSFKYFRQNCFIKGYSKKGDLKIKAQPAFEFGLPAQRAADRSPQLKLQLQ